MRFDMSQLFRTPPTADDLAFCRRHYRALEPYTHALMTLRGSHLGLLHEIVSVPATTLNWCAPVADHPEDAPLLRELILRLIARYGTPRT
jgi:hypothetical protein